MRKPPESIQKHLLVWLTAMIVTLYGFSAVGTYFFMRHSFLQQLDHHLERLAEDFIAETHRNPDGSITSEYHDLELPDYQSGDDDTSAYYELRDHLGKTLLKSPSLSGNAQLPFVPDSGKNTRVEPINLPAGQKGRVVFITFTPEVEPAGRTSLHSDRPIHLAMAESTSRLSKTLLILAGTLAMTGVILAVFTVIGVGFLVRRACRPIIDLGKLTDEIGPGKMEARLPENRAPSELRPLIVQFNQLIERLDEGISRERRFSIDIAHELRTPLAEMQILMEVGTHSNYPDVEAGSIEDPRVIYQSGEAISRRMRKIIEAITTIHRSDKSSFEPAFETVDAGMMIAASLEALPKHSRDRIDFDFKPSRSFDVKTTPELLRAVLDNLLSNAVAHSTPDTSIRVALENKEIVIENQTTELTESDLKKLDEPFWQKDAARADADRFGLGLTLVSAYLRLLDGKLSRTLDQGILKTTVTIPLS